jgi:hypothetical protein
MNIHFNEVEVQKLNNNKVIKYVIKVIKHMINFQKIEKKLLILEKEVLIHLEKIDKRIIVLSNMV